MRFCEDGPNIPDQLIDARDRGDVVFFCGAGVSYPALPDFDGLARKVLADLGAREAQTAYDREDGLDRVFTSLVKEFGGSEVDRAISVALRSPRGVDLSHHRAVLDLSRDREGFARIVTTNFDRLFERAERTLTKFVPPVLPDLGVLEPLRGLVYLHGRLTSSVPPRGRAGYVISSADFGRAYLAEGWAARFVRGLRERYTIVLLGYSANDPPMRYLLEGLGSREGAAYRSPIYAFAAEYSDVDAEEWHDKGVTPISYVPGDRSHSGLWASLDAWATASRDPEAWRGRVVGLAQQSPLTLRAFERGQVAHLVGSKAGARDFANADPLPSAEWLSVLDVYQRYAEPWRADDDGDERIDPLSLYGLDDDPPRPPTRPGFGIVVPGKDLLRWQDGDDRGSERLRLSGHRDEWTNQLPPRLNFLADWITRVMGEPAAVAWAVSNTTPHPTLIRLVRNRLDDHELPAPARHFWRCYLEAVRAIREDWQDLRRYELSSRIRREGWTSGVLRELERIVEPSFDIKRRYRRGGLPTGRDWGDRRLWDVADIGVRVASWDAELEVPYDQLTRVIPIVRRSLERMADLLAEATLIYWRTPTLHPTGERGESDDHGRKTGHFLRFAKLFKQLAGVDPAGARAEVESWRIDDPFMFAKLFLFAASLPDLISPVRFTERLMLMSPETFWDSDQQRELLFALRVQWPGLSASDRDQIEGRIAELAPPYDDDGDEDRLRRTTRSTSLLRWLQLHGCSLSDAGAERLEHLKTRARDDWNDSWAWQADDSHGPWGGWVEQVTEPQGLEDLSASEIVATARELSTSNHRALRDYRPFGGLVEVAPRKALAALRIEVRRGGFPRDFWENLISHWPKSRDARATLLLAHSIARLPDEAFQQLRFATARFCNEVLGQLPKAFRKNALSAFDALVSRYLTSDPAVLASGIHRGGDNIDEPESEVTISKAINSPGGSLSEAMFTFLGPRRRQGAMPTAIASRLERLLTLPGDGASHAACVIARRLSWLEYWHGDWVRKLLPRFALDDAIAPGLWHGLAADRALLTIDAERSIKPGLLSLLQNAASWYLDPDTRRSLDRRMVWLSGPNGGRGIVSYAEARVTLQAGSDADRAEALSALRQAMETTGAWVAEVRPFFVQAWPRQQQLQSSETANVMVQIIEKAGDAFADAVELLGPYLRPVEHLDIFAYRMRRNEDDGRNYAARFPEATLDLFDRIVGPTSSHWGLAEILDRIVERRPALRHDDRWRRLRNLG